MAKACKTKTVKSMREFQKRYFPKGYTAQKMDSSKDSEEIAIEMANASIKKINKKLARA